jgi:hypothetical protein
LKVSFYEEFELKVNKEGEIMGLPIIVDDIFVNKSNPLPVRDFIQSAATVTPSDTVDLTASPSHGLYVGVAGDVKAILSDGSNVVFKALSAGIVYPFSVSRVYATGTTATNILALY